MKLSWFALLLGALPALGGTPPAVEPIALYTKFEQNPSGAVARALRQELQEIMEPLGLAYEWRTLPTVQTGEVVSDLVVVTFRGRCESEGNIVADPAPAALGWTHISDGVILPFTEVDCNRVRNFVQRQLLAEKPSLRDEHYGRALARVLAHELYHVFAKTTHHASAGVAKSAYTVSDLMTDYFVFEKLEPSVMAKMPGQQAGTE